MYVIQNQASECYIALDAASGGYPYEVEHVTRAQIWDSVEEAERYMVACSPDISPGSFPEAENWKVLRIEVITSEVPMSRNRCVVIERGVREKDFISGSIVKIPAQHKAVQQQLWSSIANGYRHDPHWKFVMETVKPDDEDDLRIEFAHRDEPSQRVRVYTESK